MDRLHSVSFTIGTYFLLVFLIGTVLSSSSSNLRWRDTPSFASQSGNNVNPVANQSSIVIAPNGMARFTVITDRLIRIEFSGDGQFNDAATFAIINRLAPTPYFVNFTDGRTLTIKTDYLTLTYDYAASAEGFSPSNLEVQLMNNNITVSWNISSQPTGNLLGTIRTLDDSDGEIPLYCPSLNYMISNEEHCSLGLISRDGWAIINDTKVVTLDDGGSDNWQWWNYNSVPEPSTYTCAMSWSDRQDCNPGNTGGEETCQSKGCCYYPVTGPNVPWCFYPMNPVVQQDLYFFGHGQDYWAAMKDYALVSGQVSMFPRFVYGPQYSRWHAYNEMDEIQLLEEAYEGYGIPLDVLVLDMDWHYTYMRGGGNCNPAINGWTGYTWNTDLFPSPSRFLSWAKKKGLHVTNNMHPAAGVQCLEKLYPPFARVMGVNPSTNNSIAYDIQNKTYSSNFMDIVLAPLGGPSGIDYWWIDWQQGETGLPWGINPTSWVNYVFLTAQSWWSSGDRPLIMARWGGYGNQRLPTIGFSGDVVTSWDSLAWQPYFTATASNVGFSWSHDLGGFEGQPDPELYTRWIQWGAWSNFLRTHCDGKKLGGGYDRAIWLYPYDNFVIMRELFVLRSRMVPYIYTAAYMAYQTSVSIVHPMYYHYPDVEEAYQYTNQYMFGYSIFASPIVTPSFAYNITTTTIWIPEGVWIEWYSGASFTGPQVITRNYTIEEVPVFVQAGSVIPMNTFEKPTLGSAQRLPTSLAFNVFPGLTPGQESVSFYYEDDGKTTAYLSGESYITYVNYQVLANDTVQLVVQPPVGTGFDEMPNNRTYQLNFLGVWPASIVTVNGVEVPFNSDFGDPYAVEGNNWSYDTLTLSVLVNLQELYTIWEPLTVKVQFIESINTPLLTKGYQRTLRLLQDSKDLLDGEWGVYYPSDYPSLLQAVGVGLNMTVSTAVPLLQNLDQMVQQARNEIAALSPVTPTSLACAAWLKMA